MIGYGCCSRSLLASQPGGGRSAISPGSQAFLKGPARAIEHARFPAPFSTSVTVLPAAPRRQISSPSPSRTVYVTEKDSF
eukprot:scaffold91603_cov57-Phaeocystis_antarctica.AAC.2